jgi:hypothetical protein
MSTVAERPARQRRQQLRSFTIVFRVEGLDYFVIPLAPDPEVAVRAFRFKKADGTTYDVSWNAEGRFSCECLGFLKHGMCKDGRGCKHVRCLVAAGMMPAPASKD